MGLKMGGFESRLTWEVLAEASGAIESEFSEEEEEAWDLSDSIQFYRPLEGVMEP